MNNKAVKLARHVLKNGILDMPCPDCEKGFERHQIDDHGDGDSRCIAPGHYHDDASWYCHDARAQGVIDELARAVLEQAEEIERLEASNE